MIKEDNLDLINNFLEKLEEYGLEIGSRLDELEKEKANYVFFVELKRMIQEDVIGFCSSYNSTSEDGKKEFASKLLELFKDQEIVDNIIQEIINLYYLYESGLIDLDEIAPQREQAEENIKTLILRINNYLEETNVDQIAKDDERLSHQLERLVDLGTIIESNEPTAIEDMDFLEETLERLDISETDKTQIVIEIINHNLSVYNLNLSKKKNNKPVTTEIEELDDNLVISEETKEQIAELLAQKDVVKRIVEIINDEFLTVIDIKSSDPNEQEQVRESIEAAREEIEKLIKANKDITPEQALSSFFEEFDETEKKKRGYLKELLKNTPDCSLSIEEQEELLQIASSFLEERKNLISEMNSTDKSKIRSYMNTLYQDVENRQTTYGSGIYETQEALEKEAAYEIAVYIDLLESVPEEDHATISKVCKKLEEIITSVDLARKKEPVPVESEEGNLFFIMKDDDTSTLEEDLGSDSKGISNVYYSEIKNQLAAIEERSTRRLAAAQPVNPGFKAIKKEGVKYTTGTRTKIFFIPFGKKDSIIVGLSFIKGKDTNKEQENRVKKYQKQIEELKDRLLDPETYMEERIKATRQRNKIIRLLNSNRELNTMLEEEEEKEEIKHK